MGESVHEPPKRSISDFHRPPGFLDRHPIGIQSQMFWGPHLFSEGTKGWGVQCVAQTPLSSERDSRPTRSLHIVNYPTRVEVFGEIASPPLLPVLMRPFYPLLWREMFHYFSILFQQELFPV